MQESNPPILLVAS